MLTVCLLPACTFGTALPEEETGVALRGIITPIPLDLLHSTTHRFTDVDGTMYKAKSGVIFLREYENVDATIIGDIVYKKDSDPILTITSVQEVHEQRVKEIELADLGLVLSLPSLWQLSQKGETVLVAVPNTENIITVEKTNLTVLPTGKVVFKPIGAIKTIVESGAAFYYVTSPEGIVLIKSSLPLTTLQEQQFFAMITVLASSSSSQSSVSTGTGAELPLVGPVCGGSAGLLCPAQYYCNVTDTVTSIGRCTLIKQ